MANSELSCTKLSFILNEYKVKENVNSPTALKVICHSVFSISTTHNLNTTFALTVWIWAETQHVIIYQINSFFKTNMMERGTLIRRYFVLAYISVMRKVYMFCSLKIVTLFDKHWQLLSYEGKKKKKPQQKPQTAAAAAVAAFVSLPAVLPSSQPSWCPRAESQLLPTPGGCGVVSPFSAAWGSSQHEVGQANKKASAAFLLVGGLNSCWKAGDAVGWRQGMLCCLNFGGVPAASRCRAGAGSGDGRWGLGASSGLWRCRVLSKPELSFYLFSPRFR